jgi:two-component system, OmpR family, manganese sensing sensor histidine kinase
VRAAHTLVPRTLGRRLFLSYVAAFAVVIVVFALGVRFSFVAILNGETTARLDTLARAGTAAVQFERNGYVVTEVSLGGFSLHSESEGLEWFDPLGRLRARRGQTLEPPRPPHQGVERFASPAGVLATYTLSLHDTHGVERGFVRATEVYNSSSDPARALDRGLVAGAILALLAGAFGGTLLARSSVARIEESYERLRQFTADASHELRTPLSALAGTASVAIREAPELSAVTRARLEDIGKISQQMRRLIDDLLILARADQSMEHELFVVNIDELVATIRARFAQPAFAQGMQFEFAGPPDLEIYGNPDQIERIVANLVENAIRHTPPGGSVTVSWTADQQRMQIAVRDTGAGIAPQHLARVFDRFWQADPTRGVESGSGLGLAIARALARRHGGDVSLASELGEGSTFTLTLPRRPPALG